MAVKSDVNFFDEQPKPIKAAKSAAPDAGGGEKPHLPIPPEPDPAGFSPYPHNGAPVFLIDAFGARHEAVWRKTRRVEGGRWVYAAFWAKRNSGGQPIGFEPVGYEKHEEPPLVGRRA